MSNEKRTWLITGCSTGLGRGLVEVLASRGERVVATARKPESIVDLAEKYSNVATAKLDVTSAADIAHVVNFSEETFGGIDVLVNNAGYGYIASVEEAEESAYKQLIDTNLIGVIELTRAVLPGMRSRRSGHVVNVSSVGGIRGNPGSAYYAATKFAVIGFSEALAQEVRPLGIRVTAVAPGPFRTDWSGRSLKTGPTTIADYDSTVHQRIRKMAQSSGEQPGDPIRAGEAIVAAVNSDTPPMRLVLGRPGLNVVRKQLSEMTAELDAWEKVTLSSDFPD